MRVKNALNRLSQLRGRAVLLLMLLLMMQPFSLTAQDSTSEVIDTEVVDTAVAAIEEPDTAALPDIISLRKVPDSMVSAMQKNKRPLPMPTILLTGQNKRKKQTTQIFGIMLENS